MATSFYDIKRKAENLSYIEGYLAKTEEAIEEIHNGENAVIRVHTGSGKEMDLFNVPTSVIIEMLKKYRVEYYKDQIESGKAELQAMIME